MPEDCFFQLLTLCARLTQSWRQVSAGMAAVAADTVQGVTAKVGWTGRARPPIRAMSRGLSQAHWYRPLGLITARSGAAVTAQ